MKQKMKLSLTVIMCLAVLLTLFTVNAYAAQTITSDQTGTQNGYFFSFWNAGGGSVTMTLGDGGNYSVNWSNCNNFTCGKGWNPGSARDVTYSGSFNGGNNGYLALYGWTKNKLVEYYVVENYGSWTPPGGQSNGTLTSDGATYTTYKMYRSNAPSIIGTASFDQYWSVRSSKRSSGTITFSNHINAWKNRGMDLGSTWDYLIMETEGYQSSGSSNITVGGDPVSPSPTNTPTKSPTNTPSNTPVPSNTVSTGDFNNDGYINMSDVVMLAASYNAVRGKTNYVAAYDLNNDGAINMSDVMILATNFNKKVEVATPTKSTPPTSTPTQPSPTPTKPSPTAGPSTGPNGNVYICFDDGPNNGNSQTLINNLKSAGINQVTFFVWGDRISSNSSAWTLYKNSGYSLQNHSWSHQHMGSWSYQQVYDDVQKCSQAIVNEGKPKPTKIRLPYLESGSGVTQACSALGLTIVSPNVDSQDWNGASTQSIINACNNLQANGNVLMHDQYQTTDSAISSIAQNLKNKGFGFAQY